MIWKLCKVATPSIIDHLDWQLENGDKNNLWKDKIPLTKLMEERNNFKDLVNWMIRVG